MKLAKDDLVAALRLRYDHYSAQTIFDGARTRAGLADQDAYDRVEIAAFRAALAKVGDRLTAVEARLDHLLEPAPKPGEPRPAAGDAKPAPSEPTAAEPKAPEPRAPEPRAAEPRAAEPRAAGPRAAEPRAPEPKAMPKAATSEPKARAVETTIILTGVELGDGDRVMVCGDRPELGNWEPEHARPMTRDGARWRTSLELPPGSSGSFKFFRRTADGDVIWEAGENRELVAVPQIEATWQ